MRKQPVVSRRGSIFSCCSWASSLAGLCEYEAGRRRLRPSASFWPCGPPNGFCAVSVSRLTCAHAGATRVIEHLPGDTGSFSGLRTLCFLKLFMSKLWVLSLANYFCSSLSKSWIKKNYECLDIVAMHHVNILILWKHAFRTKVHSP